MSICPSRPEGRILAGMSCHPAIFVSLLCLTLASPVHADCEKAAVRAEIALAVSQGQQAFAEMDGDRFGATRERAMQRLECLVEPLAPSDAAQIHGLLALDAFLLQDDASAVNSLRSAYATGLYTFPTTLVPEGHPLLLQVKVAQALAPGPDEPLPDISPASWLVDGNDVGAIPTDRPCILQRISPLGEVESTTYLAVGEALPDWAQPAESPAATEPVAMNSHRVALGAATGGAALLAGGLYALALQRHGQFVAPDTPQGDLPGLRTQAAVFTGTSAAAGLAAAGLGAILVIQW